MFIHMRTLVKWEEVTKQRKREIMNVIKVMNGATEEMKELMVVPYGYITAVVGDVTHYGFLSEYFPGKPVLQQGWNNETLYLQSILMLVLQ